MPKSGCERTFTYGKLGSSQFITVNYRPPSVTVTSPDKSQIMKLVQNFMLFLPVALASSLGEEGVHSCAGTITVTLASCAFGWIWLIVMKRLHGHSVKRH